jgi:hypothetical protein
MHFPRRKHSALASLHVSALHFIPSLPISISSPVSPSFLPGLLFVVFAPL